MARDKVSCRRQRNKRAVAAKTREESKRTHKLVADIMVDILENVERKKISTKACESVFDEIIQNAFEASENKNLNKANEMPSTSRQRVPIILEEDLYDFTWGSLEEYNEIMDENLTIELDKKEELVNGYRIVDIDYLLKQTLKLQAEHSRKCTGGILELIKERRHGLASTFSYRCNICLHLVLVHTEKPDVPIINKAVVWGTLSSGSTFAHTAELMSALDVPMMTTNMFYDNQRKLGTTKMENGTASCNTKNMVKPKSTLSPDEYLNLMITNSSLEISKSSWGALHPILKTVQLHEMKEANYVVGKSKECDILIMDGTLPNKDMYDYTSYRHFEISKTSDNPPIIRDISKCGTFLNGIMLGQGNSKVLNDTDTISILNPKIKLFIYKSVQNTDDDFLSEKLQEKYDVLKYLGAGGYGEVRLVSDKITGRLYAIKKMMNHSSGWTEVKILQSVKHPYIVSFIDSDVTNDAIFIIMEYMEQGDLEGLLKESRLYESHFKYIFLQVLMAVEHLHRQRIIHRDLKPSNILRTSSLEDHVFKIADFGLGKIFDENSIAHSFCGTRSYMAPEIYNKVGYDYSADVWSMGVLLCYMTTSQLPTIMEDKLTGKVDVNIPVLKNVSLDCENLIRSMLKINPKERITVQEILQHPWITMDEDVLRKVRSPLDKNES